MAKKKPAVKKAAAKKPAAKKSAAKKKQATGEKVTKEGGTVCFILGGSSLQYYSILIYNYPVS